MKEIKNEGNDSRNFEGRYRILKKEFRSIRQRLTVSDIFKYGFITLSVFLMILCLLLFNKNQKLSEENKELYKDNVSLSNTIDTYANTAIFFASAAVEMDNSNKELRKLVDQANEELEVYQVREELFDQYEWAMTYGGKKTTLTYEQIISLQEYCNERGYAPDMVDLVLAVAMKESHCNEKAYNSSTATGYCQLLDSTAKFVYTKLQGNDKYTHEVALDGETNLKMAADYLAYLYKYHGNSMSKTVNSYRGCHDTYWINTVNKYLNKNSKSLDTIQILESY